MFNNDKFVEVVIALEHLGSPGPTAQEVARVCGINHDLARKVLLRLERLGLVKALPRVGGSRGPLPYEVQQGDAWQAVVEVCHHLEAGFGTGTAVRGDP